MVYHIEEAAVLAVPESEVAFLDLICELGNLRVQGHVQGPGKALCPPQGGVPEGVYLAAFARPGGDRPAVHSGVHPGESRAGIDQAVLICAEVIARSGVSLNHIQELRPELGQEIQITCCIEISARRLNKPQRGVHGVVGPGPEVVGQHTVLHRPGKGAEDQPCCLISAGGEEKAGQGDHGVPSPVIEPVVAGDEAQSVAPLDQEAVRRSSQRRNGCL